MCTNDDVCTAPPDHRMARTPHHFKVWAKILKLLFDVSPQLDRQPSLWLTSCDTAATRWCGLVTMVWKLFRKSGKNCFALPWMYEVRRHMFCCCEFESPSGCIGTTVHCSTEHEHNDAEHCGTLPYVSNNCISPTIYLWPYVSDNCMCLTTVCLWQLHAFDNCMSPTNTCLRQTYTKDDIERTSATFCRLTIIRQRCRTQHLVLLIL